MNITPVSTNHLLPTTDTERPVGAVRPTNRTGDALRDGDHRQPPAQRPTVVDPEAMAARLGGLVHPHNPSLSVRANRALASYAEVSGTSRRSRLEALLGFDDYA